MTNVVSHLVAQRAEMGGEVQALQMRVRHRPKALPPRHAGYRGEGARAVMNILRTEKRPMGARDIALRVMAERSLNAADKHVINTIKKRIGARLRHNRKRGLVRTTAGPGKRVAWEIS